MTRYTKPVRPVASGLTQKSFSPINTALIVAGVLGAMWIYTSRMPQVQPDTKPPVVVSSLDKIKSVLDGVEDRSKVHRFGDLMSAMSDVVSRCDPAASRAIRQWIVDSQTYYTNGTDLRAGIGVGPEMEAIFKSKFGMEDRVFSQAEMKELAALFNSIAELCK